MGCAAAETNCWPLSEIANGAASEPPIWRAISAEERLRAALAGGVGLQCSRSPWRVDSYVASTARPPKRHR